MLVEEEDLEFSYFNCCGDEDLYPFGCPKCQRLMVFCYECDTLYSDLTPISGSRDGVNHFKPQEPIFSCPGCGFAFEYHFMKDHHYKVEHAEWIGSGYGHLLRHWTDTR